MDASRLYTRIVAQGSFTAAGNEPSRSRATAAHQVGRLESGLGAQRRHLPACPRGFID